MTEITVWSFDNSNITQAIINASLARRMAGQQPQIKGISLSVQASSHEQLQLPFQSLHTVVTQFTRLLRKRWS